MATVLVHDRMALISYLKNRFESRSLIGSDLLILYVTMLHTSQGITILYPSEADTTIGMYAFLEVFGDRWGASLALLGTSVTAVIGQWWAGLDVKERFVFLFMQWSLLCLSSLSAIWFMLIGNSPDGTPHGWIYTLYSHPYLIFMPLLYGAAILARVFD